MKVLQSEAATADEEGDVCKRLGRAHAPQRESRGASGIVPTHVDIAGGLGRARGEEKTKMPGGLLERLPGNRPAHDARERLKEVAGVIKGFRAYRM